MKKALTLLAALALVAGLALPSYAHFGMIVPERNVIGKDDPKTIKLEMRFWHPMENNGMEMAKPEAFGCVVDGQKMDLLGSLKAGKVAGHQVWDASLPVKKPGDYVFYVTPAPYWEPAEDHYIIHYSKTVVSALDKETGWDKPVGLPMEIVPLSRPYGLYAGNQFSGQVLKDGKPLPEARVEVEFFNKDGKRKAPSDAYVTQVVKTDANGQFSFTMPWAGWWGFAALTDADQKIDKDGQPKEVEIGGILWVYTQGVK